jgi:hypothetical protein
MESKNMVKYVVLVTMDTQVLASRVSRAAVKIKNLIKKIEKVKIIPFLG